MLVYVNPLDIDEMEQGLTSLGVGEEACEVDAYVCRDCLREVIGCAAYHLALAKVLVLADLVPI